MRRLRWIRFAAALVLVVFGARRACSQTLDGKVVLADSTTPLGRVIVVASDERGNDVARTLTRRTGDFTFSFQSPGRYRVRVLRIGYRPVSSSFVDLERSARQTITVLFVGEAITLPATSVRERETCRVDADTGMSVARVWDEARKAMLSSQLATADAPLFAEWIEYERGLDSTGRIVREQRVRTVQHPTTHAFKSRPVDELMKRGYVVEEGGATTYFAPDVDVLLSDAFASSHCFQLQSSPRGKAQLVGVSFQPSRSRRDARDIEGTFWVDRTTSELTSLEFHYTNLPEIAQVAAGDVQFRRIAEGSWLVSRWSVRMPRVVAKPRRDATSRIVQSRTSTMLGGIQVTGGEVTRVLRGDSLVYRATGPRVVAKIVASDPLVPAAGAKLTLEGTDYSGIADAAGIVRIEPVLAGTYTARVSIPLMDSLGVPARDRLVEAREDVHVDSLKLPRSSDLLAAVCPRDSIKNGEGMIYGHLRDAKGRAIEDAAITATWLVGADGAVMIEPGLSSWHEQTIGTLSHADGDWHICGVPRDRGFIVRTAIDSLTDEQRVLLEHADDFTVVRLAPRVGGHLLQAGVPVAPPKRIRAAIEIFVTSSDGHAVSSATIDIDSHGRRTTVVTNSGGKAIVPDVAPGRLIIRARKIGYQQGQIVVSAEPGRNTLPIILDPTEAPVLDTVRVVGDRRVTGFGRHDEFEARRLNGFASASFTREDIRKRNPIDIWQVLTAVPSIRIVDSGTVTVESTRSARPRPDMSVEKCYLLILVDGMAMNASPGQKAFDLRLLPKPDETFGVEVFAGPSSIPLQYLKFGDGAWCGAIAVWTR
jgi:hypothetical protein